jgi:hypothetical protein
MYEGDTQWALGSGQWAGTVKWGLPTADCRLPTTFQFHPPTNR